MNLLRQYLQGAFAMIVVPQQFALGRAGEAFDEARRAEGREGAAAASRACSTPSATWPPR